MVLTNYSKVTGLVATLAQKLKLDVKITPGKRENYCDFPSEVSDLIIKITTDKARTDKLALSDSAMLVELIGLRGLITLFGSDNRASIATEKGNDGKWLKMYGAKIAIANARAMSIWKERTGQEWPTESHLCLYLGQSAVPLLQGFEDNDEDGDKCFHTAAFPAEMNIPVFMVKPSEMTIGAAGVKVVGFMASPVKGTSTLKGKMAFSGRVANFTNSDSGQLTDKHTAPQVLTALWAKPEVASDFIEATKFGGAYVRQFTDIEKGIYPVVSSAKERRAVDGKQWVNTHITVFTAEGEETFRVSGSDANAFDTVLRDLYPHTDELGNVHEPDGILFDGLRGVAYVGNSTNVKDGKTYVNAQLTLVEVTSNKPIIALEGQEFSVAHQGFITPVTLASDEHEILEVLDTDDDDDDAPIDMGEGQAVKAKMAAMAVANAAFDEDEDEYEVAAPVAVKTKAKKVTPVTIEDDEEEIGEDM